jgi:hypothetical protein
MVSNGALAVAADSERDRVTIVDLHARRITHTVTLQQGDEPGRVIEGASNRAHVILRRGGGIATIDFAQGTLVRRTAVCATPRGIDFDAMTGTLWVSCAEGTLARLREETGEIIGTQQIEPDLRDVAVIGDHVMVSRFRSADVITLNARDGSELHRAPGTEAVASTYGGTAVERNVAWRMVRTATSIALVHQVPASRVLDDSPVSGDFGDTRPMAARYYGDPFEGCASLALGAVSTVDTAGRPSAPRTFPAAVLPVDVAVNRDGSRMIVVAAGNASIPSLPQLIDANDVNTRRCDTSSGTYGYYYGTPAPSALDRMEQPNAQAIAAAFDGGDHLVVQTRQPPALYLVDEHAVIAMPGVEISDVGHQIFHSNTGGNIACASCHAEGEDDGRVWMFLRAGERRTGHLAGAGVGDGALHWRGELENFHALTSQIFTLRMAGPQLSDVEANGLQHYIRTMAAPSRPIAADTNAWERGRALFERADVGCATCHSGARLTNDQVVDVGTGSPFKVPSLVGLGMRAPYMHNGCAATLRDRFGACGGGDRHGHTSQLAAGEIDDLVTYLRTL